MENISAGAADIYLDYGNLAMRACRFTEAKIETDSGNIEAEDTCDRHASPHEQLR